MRGIHGLMVLCCVVGLATGVACSSDGEASSKPAGDGPIEMATFAGGCFWCVESAFDDLDGVIDAVSGYTGGDEADPTYEQVGSGRTGHAEAVRIRYDASVTDYRAMLDVFWRHIDPTDAGGQFADRGSQYRTAIFVHDAGQRRLAEQSKRDLEASGKFDRPIVTEIVDAGPFYEAEEYHQDYHKKNPAHYKRYYWGSGRGPFLEKTWGKDEPTPRSEGFVMPSDEKLKKMLTPLQYKVTREEGTEPPFSNEYWDNHAEGIYVDRISGKPLFSSTDKYDSGSGWPSFVRPLGEDEIVERVDKTLGMVRTEVRSKTADSHLGHVFPDGPKPTGLRYCINSAALRFVPKERLEEEGYGEYRKLFD